MGYNVIAYEVDKSKIEALWGSQNDDFAVYFLDKYEAEIEDLADGFEIETIAFKICIEDIIRGKISQTSELNYIYGYVYELLCQEFGNAVEPDDFLCYLDEATDENHKAFIPIPANSDWPEFHSVEHTDLEKRKGSFKDHARQYELDDYYFESVDLIFNQALLNKKDLVFFGY